MLTEKTQNLAKKFICDTCNFMCNNKYDFNIHLATRKHKMLTSAIFDAKQKNANAPLLFACSCGTSYHHKSSLSRHKKIAINQIIH
jgi:hypothetical protein